MSADERAQMIRKLFVDVTDIARSSLRAELRVEASRQSNEPFPLPEKTIARMGRMDLILHIRRFEALLLDPAPSAPTPLPQDTP